MITKAQYQAQAAQGYNRIPLVQELLADLDTPLSLYLKLANQPFSYLLESVVGGERFGRYSFIGLPCRDYIKVSGNRTEIYQNHQLIQTHHSNPLDIIAQYHAQFKTPDIPNLPRFTGGLVGYFGYESIYYFEHIAHRLRQPEKADSLNTPDILLMLSQELAVVDNLSGKIHLIVYADPSHPQGYETARAKLEHLREKLRRPFVAQHQPFRAITLRRIGFVQYVKRLTARNQQPLSRRCSQFAARVAQRFTPMQHAHNHRLGKLRLRE